MRQKIRKMRNRFKGGLTVEFRNLKKQYEVLKAEIDSGITEVCTNANFISGVKVRQLEK